MHTLKIMVMMLFGLFTSELFAKDYSGPYSAALDNFRQGDFAAANKIYLEAIQDGQTNASLYYNLGNSLYKNGQFGASMAAHLRARSLAPSDPDIRYNLQFLMAKTKDKLDTRLSQPVWLEWSAGQWLGERALMWWTSGLLAIAFTLLGWQLWWGRWSPSVIFLTALCFFTSFYPGLSLLDTLWRRPDWGAIVSPVIDILASPTVKNAVVIFQLHEGAPFAVVNEAGDWFKIQLSDGKTGWVQREHVAIFGKKYFSYQTTKSEDSLIEPRL
jgi:hypothetical protein